ncbi:peptide ABC transporter substrate-binding protein [Teredinibacter waterburyi]|uniref:peptide ABC transporter substrate-binding protein n=1 Tax=Teredinibacter waterburyi TaxID=1500538 RepID=UPI00165FAE18|nr:peptide ABC transporter substrate-binding protein [Teredinibacter waterburyi]
MVQQRVQNRLARITTTPYKPTLWLALIILVCISQLACSRQTPTNVEFGNRNQVLFIANGDEPQSLDPHKSVGSPDYNILSALFEGLTSRDPKTLSIIPAAASQWQISTDRLTYTFSLRKNARWSNGDPVTASDFVNAWHRALTPTTANANAYQLFTLKNAEAFYTGAITNFDEVGVTAIDPLTLKVTLETPREYFLETLDYHNFYPLHRSAINSTPLDNWTRPDELVSNGPFTLSEWQLNRVIEVVKNKYYWDVENVKLNAIQFLPISDQQAEERAFRSGQVHLTNTPTMAIEKMETYRQNDPHLLKSSPLYSSYYYVINSQREPFNKVKVRRALAFAIDRQLLVSKITKGGEQVAKHFVPPLEYQEFADSLKTHTDPLYQPELAQQLLSEAGYPNGVGFPVKTLLFNSQDNHRKIATAIQQMWAKTLNIKVNLAHQEWKVFSAAQNSMDYDISRAGWIADYLDPGNFYETLLSDSGNNDTGWANTHYDNTVKMAQVTSNSREREQLFATAKQILDTEMPVIPLFYPADNNLVRPEVINWYGNKLHRHPYKSVYLNTP